MTVTCMAAVESILEVGSHPMLTLEGAPNYVQSVPVVASIWFFHGI